MSWICEACSKGILGTSSDPLISTKGLGWKNYHYTCASRLWSRLTPGSHLSIDSKDPVEAEVKESMKPTKQIKEGTGPAPSKTGRGKFFVQCTITKDGSPTVRLSDFAKSLQEAEDYFKTQVLACPVGGGVSCIIYLMLNSGNKTQVDELVHPALSLSAGQAVEDL